MATAELLINIMANASQAIGSISELEMQTRLLEQIMTNTGTATGGAAEKTASFASAAREALPAALALGAAGASIDAAFGLAVRSASTFDTSMVAIRNNTVMTTADSDLMRQAVLQLGAESSAPLDQLGQGFMHITNLGYSAKDSVQILEAAMKSAVSTGGNTADTANILAQAMHEFGIPAANAAQTMDMLHTAAAEGNMTLEEFSKSFGVLAAWSAAVGVPLDQAAAAMSAMTRHGFDAAQAATQVKDEIAHLINPSATARNAIAALGNSIGSDLTGVLTPAELHAKGLTGVINEIAAAMDKAGLSTDQQTATWLKIIPNMRGGAAGFVLAGRGADDFSSILTDLHAKLGVTDEAFARMKDTAGFQWGEFTNKLQELGIAVGSILLPPLLKLVDGASALIGAFMALPTPVQAVFSYLGVGVGVTLSLAGALGVAAWTSVQLVTGFTAVSAVIIGEGTAAATAAAENTALAASEGAVATGAVAAAPAVASLGSAAGAAGVGLATAAGSLGVIGAAIFAFSQPLRDAIDTLYTLKAAMADIPADAMNPLQRSTVDLLNKLPDRSPTAAAVPESPTVPVPAAVPPVTLPPATADSLAKQAAKATKDNATSQLQAVQDAAAQRKADFDVASVGAETNVLSLKMAQTSAEQDLLGYKRQIEDIDRNAINFAEKRLQLDEESALLKAQMAESPLKAQNEDIRYQEERIKAQLKAAHAGGPAVDEAAAHAQLHDLAQQDARMQPALLDAGHNVTLANRAKSDTAAQVGLETNATSQAKLGVDEAMAPAALAATMGTRAVEDAQKLLDLDKLKFDVNETGYKSALLVAEAQKKTADHVLFALDHPDMKQARATSDLNVPEDPRQQQRTTGPTRPYDPSRAYDAFPGGGSTTSATPNVTVNVGQVGQSPEQVWEAIKGQFIAAWNAAMNGHPLSGPMGGSYNSSRGGASVP